MDDYAMICNDCTGYGDDYYLDGEGNWICACDDCPYNNSELED